MKVTKRKQTWANLDTKKVYAMDEAVETLRGFCSKKFDESLEIAIRLGIDVAKADQNIRGMLSLPNGTGITHTNFTKMYVSIILHPKNVVNMIF